MKTKSLTLIAFLLVSAVVGLFGWQWFSAEDKRLLQPGPLSYAHHQIELACDSCHGESFSGNAGIEQQCRSCHAAELKAMDDAHGQKKFADPRNAAELAILDATQCLNCHQEHQPAFTRKMSVTQPVDYCIACHQEVFTERESHMNLAADTCTNSGCHNYHDASTLYENFLVAHMNEPALLPVTTRITRTLERKAILLADRLPKTAEPLSAALETAHRQWQQSAHAWGHANCSDCHQNPDNWQADIAPCESCHEAQSQGFQQGHHGMRTAVGLSPLEVSMAKLPMHKKATEKILDCHSCHQAHDYNTRIAEADACLGCHNDKHSQQWQSSKHAELWQRNPDSGASCATCHMPRLTDSSGDVQVEHNNSANLRPNDKMLKTVCMNCHGVEFSLSALADQALIDNNFNREIDASHPSMDFVRTRQQR